MSRRRARILAVLIVLLVAGAVFAIVKALMLVNEFLLVGGG